MARVLLILLASCALMEFPAAQQPDIVIMVLDDVSHDMLAVRKNRPNLIALANQGLVFYNCHAMSLCSPSRRTLLTGLWTVGGMSGSICSGPEDVWTLPPEAALLPEFLPDYGAGFFGKTHFRSEGGWKLSPQAQGFDVWRAGTPSSTDTCGEADYWTWLRVDDGTSRITLNEYHPTSVRQEFAAWWLNEPSPKLAVIAPVLAHTPFHRPPNSYLPSGYPATTTDAAKYEAMLVAIDDMVGTIMALIDLHETILVVVGDNGSPVEVGGEKGTSREGGTHVPFLMAGPGIPHAQSNALVHVADILPTLIGANTGDGKDLGPLIDGTVTKVHDYILCGHVDPEWPAPADVCARGLRYKFRRHGPQNTEELYDLLTDPSESINRLGDPTLAAKEAAMRAWLDANLP